MEKAGKELPKIKEVKVKPKTPEELEREKKRLAKKMEKAAKELLKENNQ